MRLENRHIRSFSSYSAQERDCTTPEEYNCGLRNIVFPAGILQPVNVRCKRQSWRELDAEGKLGDWWTGDHAKAFEAGAVLGASIQIRAAARRESKTGELTMIETSPTPLATYERRRICSRQPSQSLPCGGFAAPRPGMLATRSIA